MSVLIVGAEGEVGEAVIARLVEQGDEVRVIEPDERAGERWRALGAHVATGSPGDADLVERAAQNVRTLVALRELDYAPLVQGAVAAGVGRFVVAAEGSDRFGLEDVDVEFVILLVAQSPFRRRPSLAPAALALAVDAADDLAGAPRIYVDLRVGEGWRRLGLDPPASKA